MNLTAGTVLQSSKYVIQEILNQNDFGITYKATHAYLDQPIVLQTFSQKAQQQGNFAQLKQQFMEAVRSQVKQPSQQLRILDCFEEGELPFVVLQFIPEQAPPRLEEWLPLPSQSVSSRRLSPDAGSSQPISLPDQPTQEDQVTLTKEQPAATTVAVSSDTIAQPASGVASSRSQSPQSSSEIRQESKNSNTAFPPPASEPSTELLPQPQSNGSTKTVTVSVGQRRSPQNRPKSKVPVALMLVSFVGGCVGAGAGLALRLDTATPEEVDSPRLSLFRRDQSFPSDGRWPVQEEALYEVPEPTLEQPLYRSTPSLDYSDPSTIDPLPPDPSIPPDLSSYPSPSPYVEEDLPDDSEPLEPEEVTPPSDATGLNPPETIPDQEAPLIDELPGEIDSLPPLDPIAPDSSVNPVPLPSLEDSGIPPTSKSIYPDDKSINNLRRNNLRRIVSQ